jgi:hypothetical protein
MFIDLLHWFVHDARIWVTESAPTPPGAFLSRLASLFFRIVRRCLGLLRAAAGDRHVMIASLNSAPIRAYAPVGLSDLGDACFYRKQLI